MKRLLIFIIALICSASLYAQQDAMFTHYMFNTIAINPGYAGSRDALTITGLHRQQWVGFEGAPTTQTVSAHSPVLRENIGVGLSFINDKIGPINMTSFFLDFSYTIKVTKTSKLAFGLKAGTNMMKDELNTLDLDNPNDAAFQDGMKNQFLPNFGAGLYYYTDRWYVGASIPKILQNDFDNGAADAVGGSAAEARHYFIIAGTYFNLNDNLKLKPTTFFKYTQSAPFEVDLSAQLIYKDMVWGGLMYRTGDAFGILAGVNITPVFSIGYSFDFSLPNRTFVNNGGSHEIMLRYDFIFGEEKKIRSPRYF